MKNNFVLLFLIVFPVFSFSSNFENEILNHLNGDLKVFEMFGKGPRKIYEYSSFSDLVINNDFYLSQKIFNYEVKSRNLMELISVSVENESDLFSLDNLEKVNVNLFLDKKSGLYTVGSFDVALNEAVRGSFYFVANAEHGIMYIGITNQHSNLLSTTLPVFAKWEIYRKQGFDRFDLDINEYLSQLGKRVRPQNTDFSDE